MSATITLPDDIVENTERKFGSDTKYVYATVVFEDGTESPMMLTLNEVEVAIDRAAKNPEDVPRNKSFWSALFGG